MGQWQDYRQAVRDTLKKKGKTTYWLHAELGQTITRQHLYAYLRGESGISLEVQSRINKVLGLRFTDE
jgi:hypothetical protein